jgi:hypothetical protein
MRAKLSFSLSPSTDVRGSRESSSSFRSGEEHDAGLIASFFDWSTSANLRQFPSLSLLALLVPASLGAMLS